MPTKRPGHKATETLSLEEALAARELPGDGMAGRRARSRLAESIRAGSLPIDADAADAVKLVRLPG